MPSRLVFLSWRPHTQSTTVCPGGPMPSLLKFASTSLTQANEETEGRLLTSPWSLSLVHHSRTHVPSCTTHVVSRTTVMHLSRAPLSLPTGGRGASVSACADLTNQLQCCRVDPACAWKKHWLSNCRLPVYGGGGTPCTVLLTGAKKSGVPD